MAHEDDAPQHDVYAFTSIIGVVRMCTQSARTEVFAEAQLLGYVHGRELECEEACGGELSE